MFRNLTIALIAPLLQDCTMLLAKYNTRDVPKSQQLDYWNDAICDTFTHLKCEQTRKNINSQKGFSASIECCDMESFQLSKVTSDASLVSRTKPHINQASSEDMLLHFQTLGSTKNSQDDKHVILKSGDFTLCRNLSPYAVEIENYHEMIVARIPIDRLRQYTNPQQIPTGLKFQRSDPFSKIVGDSLMQAWQARDQGLSTLQINSLSETTLSLLGTLLNANAIAEPLSMRQRGHLSIVKSFILDNLHRSDLSILEIAHNANVTQRYISRLFKLESTSCSQFILSQRLKVAARHLLSTSYQHLKIIDIAFNTGFNSIEHFNRSFKRQYQMAPTRYRQK
ncbi:MAG: helix-turn-helix domain-containing protein [Arenicella sp.]|nr:helix-turn-helix domain-containing protein [Arenicella sp.]